MRKALTRFLFSLSIPILFFIAWVILESPRILFNPNAGDLAEITGSGVLIFKDQGKICFSIDESTSKARARITTYPSIPLATSVLYQTANCRAVGSEISCSSLFVLSVRKEPMPIEPWMAHSWETTETDPVDLQEGAFDVYIGENYQGRMIVTTGENTSGSQCRSPQGTLEFTIPPTNKGQKR